MQLIGLMVLCMVSSVWVIELSLKKATVIPQYQHTSVEDEYGPAYENTLPGITNIATPIAKSTPVTQASHIPVVQTILERDIVEPMSS